MSRIVRRFLAISKKCVNAGARIMLSKNITKSEPDVEAGITEEINYDATEVTESDSSIEVCLSSSQSDTDSSSIEIISMSSVSGHEKLICSYQSDLGFSSLSFGYEEILNVHRFMKQLGDEIDRANLSREQLKRIRKELKSTVETILTKFKQEACT